MPEISVVMPVFNGEKYLSESIDSILSQSFKDFEFIIVCEYGSSKDSLDIVARYAERDRRIRPIYNTHRLGISASLNVGLDAARGKYIARMDGDDISGCRRFEIQKLFLDTYPEIGMVGIVHSVINAPNWLVDYVTDPDLFEPHLLFFVPTRHPTIMFRRNVAEACHYDEQLAGVEDYDFYYKVSKVTRITNINEPSLFAYRRTGDNASYIYSNRDEQICKKIMRKIISDKMGITFTNEQIDVIHYLSHIPYNRVSKEHYTDVVLRLEELLGQIESKNEELNVYKSDCLLQTLQHRWFREKYKLDYILKSKIPKEVLNIWRNSRYYSPWF